MAWPGHTRTSRSTTVRRWAVTTVGTSITGVVLVLEVVTQIRRAITPPRKLWFELLLSVSTTSRVGRYTVPLTRNAVGCVPHNAAQGKVELSQID